MMPQTAKETDNQAIETGSDDIMDWDEEIKQEILFNSIHD